MLVCYQENDIFDFEAGFLDVGDLLKFRMPPEGDIKAVGLVIRKTKNEVFIQWSDTSGIIPYPLNHIFESDDYFGSISIKRK